MVEIALESVNPTTFNFVNDLVFQALAILLGLAATFSYGNLLSAHLRNGGTIPVKALGEVPRDIVGGIRKAHALNWSLPMIVFVGILVVHHLSHAVADLGILFKTLTLEGPKQPVLNLSFGMRNKDILFETTTPPSFLPEMAILIDGEADDTVRELERTRIDDQGQLSKSFLAAVDGIAKGESHFLSAESRIGKGLPLSMSRISYAGIDEAAIFLAKQGEFLAGIDFILPVNCSGEAAIHQQQGIPDEGNDEGNGIVVLKNTATLPNCTFSSLRSSGIYGRRPARAEITGYLTYFSTFNETRITGQRDYSLVVNGFPVNQFYVPREARDHARNRPEWKRGRELFGFEALGYGDLLMPLGRTVLASGDDRYASFVQREIGESDLVQSRQYFLVHEISGDCPLDPAGVQMPSCMAISDLSCEVFPEDFLESTSSAINPGASEIECSLESVHLLWGRNFRADGELVTAVAGVVGRNVKTLPGFQDRLVNQRLSVNQRVFFHFHLIPAAMFSLSTVDEYPSEENPVRVVLTEIYFIGTFLPIAVALVCVVASIFYRNNRIDVPTSPDEFMTLGHNIDGQLLTSNPDDSDASSKKEAEIHIGIVDKGGSARTELIVERKCAFTTPKSSEVNSGTIGDSDVLEVKKTVDDEETSSYPHGKEMTHSTTEDLSAANDSGAVKIEEVPPAPTAQEQPSGNDYDV